MKTFRKNAPRPQLEAEAQGLQAIAATNTIRVPEVLGFEERHGSCVLLLEHLEFAPPDAAFGDRFGRALAALHAAAAPLQEYGWTCDNFVGATPQVNARHSDWLAFWRECRLLPMCQRLRGHAPLAEAVDCVIRGMDRLFDDVHAPRPSLVHGDLWSGNWGMLRDGTPVIFDPCVSCSDAEADLAMMDLFGSPPPGFWQAYGSARPLAAGLRRRKRLYHLYHLLNHAVLFGGSYPAQALACAKGLADSLQD